MPQEDLSFLECLESVDTLQISSQGALRTTTGMHRLTSLGTLYVDYYSTIEAIEGLDGVIAMRSILLPLHHAVHTIDVGALQSIETIAIGGCIAGQASIPPGPLLTTGDFSSLIELTTLIIEGNPSLMEVTILDALLENGATSLETASFRDNPSLPETDVLAKLEMLGTAQYYLCGNLGGEPCMCAGPD